MRCLTFLGVLALLQTFDVAWAQGPSGVASGTRVRITEFESGKRKPHAGTVVTAGRDEVVLRLDGSEEIMPFAVTRIARFDVSRGMKGHTGAGIGLGLLAGASAGALVGVNQCGTCGGGESDGLAKALNALIWSGIGGGAGMLVGGIIGARHKTERWEEVPSSRWRLTAGPRRGGFGLVLSRRS
jgi:hypothetical protein